MTAARLKFSDYINTVNVSYCSVGLVRIICHMYIVTGFSLYIYFNILSVPCLNQGIGFVI